MAEPTDAEKARAEQETALKKLVKDALSEYVTENAPKQRTTGRDVPSGDADKPKSVFEQLFPW
jgi:hypothetical protein